MFLVTLVEPKKIMHFKIALLKAKLTQVLNVSGNAQIHSHTQVHHKQDLLALNLDS